MEPSEIGTVLETVLVKHPDAEIRVNKNSSSTEDQETFKIAMVITREQEEKIIKKVQKKLMREFKKYNKMITSYELLTSCAQLTISLAVLSAGYTFFQPRWSEIPSLFQMGIWFFAGTFTFLLCEATFQTWLRVIKKIIEKTKNSRV